MRPRGYVKREEVTFKGDLHSDRIPTTLTDAWEGVFTDPLALQECGVLEKEVLGH